MTKEVTVQNQKKELLNFDEDRVALIRKTIAPDLNENEFEFYIAVAKSRGLDPLTGQIHAVKRSSNDSKKMTIQVGIDGFRLIAHRTGEFAGCDKTDFTFDKSNKLVSAEVTVYRLVQGTRCPFSAFAFWDEYYPGEKMGFMWRKHPKVMLSKCAEAQALRKAFPNDLSGLYEPSEINEREVNPKTISRPVLKAPEKPKKEARIKKMLEYLEPMGVSFYKICARYKISNQSQITNEMLDELAQIAKDLKKDSNAFADYFPESMPVYDEEFEVSAK